MDEPSSGEKLNSSWARQPSRRQFLQAAAATSSLVAIAPAAAWGAGAADTSSASNVRLVFRESTNGSLSVVAKRAVAEVQGTLWTWDRGQNSAEAREIALGDLEPTRPSLSPDGRSIVVNGFQGGKFHIWKLQSDGRQIENLTDGPWDDRAPSWSADGQKIAFCSERGGDPVKGSPYRIWILDLRTRKFLQVTGLPGQQGPFQDGPWEDFDPVWSPDGLRILFVRGRFKNGVLDSRLLCSADAASPGAVSTVVTDSSPGQLMVPAISASNRIAYLRTTPTPSSSVSLVVDGALVEMAGDIAPAPIRWSGPESLLVNIDGTFRELAFSPSSSAVASNVTVPFRATQEVKPLKRWNKSFNVAPTRVSAARGIHLPAISPAGDQVLFAGLNSLWLSSVTGSAPRQLVSVPNSRWVTGPAWARDGKSFVYSSDKDGALKIYRHELLTGSEKALSGPDRTNPALSPDGKQLASIDTNGALLVTDLASGTERTLVQAIGGGGIPGRPSWSPDGKYLVFADRNRLNNRFREGLNLLRVVDAGSGADRLYSVGGHQSIADRFDSGPLWSPDGKTMAFISDSALWLIPVSDRGEPTGPARQISTEVADQPTWTGDSRSVLYLSSGKLRLVNVSSKLARTVPLRLDVAPATAVDAVVHAGLFWDGVANAPVENVDIAIRQGRVTEVASHGKIRLVGKKIDASARTVLPGLWDTHTHPWQNTYGGRQTALQLAYGITTAVSLGGPAYEQARLREASASGAVQGPRLLITGELLDGDRVGYSMGRAHNTTEGFQRSLSRAKALDWDFVKTYVRAPANFMRLAAECARQLGVRSGSHFLSPGRQVGQDLTTHLLATQRQEFSRVTSNNGLAYQDVDQLYSGGNLELVATIFSTLPLFGLFPEIQKDPRVLQLMPASDIKTLQNYSRNQPSPAELLAVEREIAIYTRLLAAGGRVAVGTDQPLVPIGAALHVSLRSLRRYGFSALEALRTVTLAPAQLLGVDKDLGSVSTGKLADMVVINGNPFDDFQTLINTESVIKGGLEIRQNEILAQWPLSP